jgi:hypothetical protein
VVVAVLVTVVVSVTVVEGAAVRITAWVTVTVVSTSSGSTVLAPHPRFAPSVQSTYDPGARRMTKLVEFVSPVE